MRQDDRQRILTFRTKTRTELVMLFGALADGIDASYLHNTRKMPAILITGSNTAGKSAASEAMIRAWSDGHDLKGMIGRERRKMFLEARPCDGYDTVEGDFRVHDRSVRMVFNSKAYSKDHLLLEKKRLAGERAQGRDMAGGAFFYTDNKMFENNLRGVWIWADILKDHYEKTPRWQRHVLIEILRKELRGDAKFQACWNGLSQKAV